MGANTQEVIKRFLAANGKKGGNATKQAHGLEHYRTISAKAHAKRWGKKRGV